MRIGIFGGSFDPPHVGHLAVAQDALEGLELDLLYFVPARVSPFKLGVAGTDPQVRAALVELALEGHPRMRVWKGELIRPAPSYTVETLNEIAELHAGAELFLLMGSDQWASFPDWREPERIVELATVCVMGRTVGAIQDHDRFGARSIQTRRIDISSTEVRERVAARRSIRFLVPESVRREIEEHQLYRESEGQPASTVI
ncbi:MAG: nicotinate (nicotinamide) nucleotide adenylyltransferase [Gemmatimonadales bacterium]|nr:MAG: nicotinate (nicotinamide) nucleotide adenylyltransferase [Gemmatimonadales bacterium]